MAKRKTIGQNPLDTIVTDHSARQKQETAAATSSRTTVPISPAEPRQPARMASATVKPEKRAATSVQATRTQAPVQQAPAPRDLLSRIQSLEEQNGLMKWLVYGAIGLALLL